MRLAIVNNHRSPPSPGLTGYCPACGSPVIAKCGEQRVHHWAHRGERSCDPWWELETDWHQNWKQNFPEEWQEVIRQDQAGEKHIADVRTLQGLTIEFQHSHLRPDERVARETFYGEMIWVVDGRRLSRDLPRFQGAARDLRAVKKGLFIHHHPEELVPRNWLNCEVPVYFDFGAGPLSAEQQKVASSSLWCLLPRCDRPHAVLLKIGREEFIRVARERSNLLLWRSIHAEVDQWLAVEHQKREQERLRSLAVLVRQATRQRSGGTRWRHNSYNKRRQRRWPL